MKAVHHWSTYLKLDPHSHWANIARRELAKLRESTVLTGIDETLAAWPFTTVWFTRIEW